MIKLLAKLRTPILVSSVYGITSTLCYLLIGLFPGEGRLAAWYIFYFAGKPFSVAITRVTGRLEGNVPNWLFAFCYTEGVILAGMIWLFLITLIVKFFVIKFRKRDNS